MASAVHEQRQLALVVFVEADRASGTEIPDADAAVGTLDVARRIRQISSDVTRLLWYPPEACLGVCLDTLVHPSDIGALLELFSRVSSDETTVATTFGSEQTTAPGGRFTSRSDQPRAKRQRSALGRFRPSRQPLIRAEWTPRIGSPRRSLAGRSDRNLSITRVRGDTTDRVIAVVVEPQGAVRSGGDAFRIGDARVGVTGYLARGRDPPDRVVAEIGKPESTVGPGGYPLGVGDARVGVAGYVARGRDPPDPIRGVPVTKPQGAIGSQGDSDRVADRRVGKIR